MKSTKIIVITLFVSILFNYYFVIIHLNHNCTHDDNCPICALIHKFKDNLNGFGSDVSKVVIAILILFSPIEFYLKNRLFDKKEETLVGLKVELIN